jgi:hypothetical protein
MIVLNLYLLVCTVISDVMTGLNYGRLLHFFLNSYILLEQMLPFQEMLNSCYGDYKNLSSVMWHHALW